MKLIRLASLKLRWSLRMTTKELDHLDHLVLIASRSDELSSEEAAFATALQNEIVRVLG